jgi:hypothetical protein
MINWKGKGREKIKKRKRSEGNVGNEESEKRKGRDCGPIGDTYRQLHGTTEEN